MFYTKLWGAIGRNDREGCTALVDFGADPNEKEEEGRGWFPLGFALYQSKMEAVRGILESKKFKFTRNHQRQFEFSVVQAINTCPSAVASLLAAPRDLGLTLSDPQASDYYKSSLMHLIKRTTHIDNSQALASLLVQHGDDPNLILTHHTQTVLEIAMARGAWRVVVGILGSPGFVFMLGVTDNALTLAKKLLYTLPPSFLPLLKEVEAHLHKLRQAALYRQQTESIHALQRYFSAQKDPQFQAKLKYLEKLDQTSAVEIILLAMNNHYPDLAHFLIKMYLIEKPLNFTSLLRPAIENGYAQVVRILLECAVNPNQVCDVDSGHKMTLLLIAAEAKNLQIMEMLVNAGADINFNYEIASVTYTLLPRLIEKGCIQEVNWLIQRKEYNFTENSVTELLYSLIHKQLETTNLLLSKCKKFYKNIDVCSMGLKEGTVLYHAVNTKNVNAVKKLMDLGANPTRIGSTIKVSPLLHAVKTLPDHSIIPAILIFSKQFTFDDQALEALNLAIEGGKSRIALQLLAKYANSKQSLDMELWKASLRGLSAVVARLLELGHNPRIGCNVNMRNEHHDRPTPLWASIVTEDPETQELLLEAGANVNYGYEHTENGRKYTTTVLFSALMQDKVDSVMRFISHHRFTFEEISSSALLVALEKGQMQVFDLLLEKYTGTNFNLDLLTYEGDTALRIAVKTNNPPAVRSLLMRGSKPTVYHGATRVSALNLAVDKPEIFELLVSLGQFEFDEHCVEVVLECIEKNQPDLALSLLTSHPPSATISLDRCFEPAQKKGYFEITQLLIRHRVSLPPQYAMTTAFDDPMLRQPIGLKHPANENVSKL